VIANVRKRHIFSLLEVTNVCKQHIFYFLAIDDVCKWHIFFFLAIGDVCKQYNFFFLRFANVHKWHILFFYNITNTCKRVIALSLLQQMFANDILFCFYACTNLSKLCNENSSYLKLSLQCFSKVVLPFNLHPSGMLFCSNPNMHASLTNNLGYLMNQVSLF